MAKENVVKTDNPVEDVLRTLKEAEAELLSKLKPVQEAVVALEKILEKPVKKVKPAKENGTDKGTEELALELTEA